MKTTCWKRRLEAARKQRLIRKAQQAGVVNLLGEIMSAETWNRRFGTVMRMRGSR